MQWTDCMLRVLEKVIGKFAEMVEGESGLYPAVNWGQAKLKPIDDDGQQNAGSKKSSPNRLCK